MGAVRTVVRSAAVASALAAAALLLPVVAGSPAAAAAGPVPTVREAGYLTMADGTQLAYTVVRPAAPGRYPTLFEYSGYFPGRDPDPGYVSRFVERAGHYAYLGLNLPGTGCSGGTYDFFQPQEALDGVAAIEWVRQQAWSNGLVGMIGKSYPGITQLVVGAQHPEGLVAIAPGHFFSDAYRDVARPGGIANHGFAALWSFIGRPSYEFLGGPEHLLAGDAGCLRGSTAELAGLPTNPYVQLLQHPYDDPLYVERSPERWLRELKDIPMLATLAWQDEQLASRQTDLLAQLDDLGGDQWWATLTSGDHSMSRTATELADLERFYDHFLRGVDNGWDARPRVQVRWDAGRDGGRAPGWTTALAHWSEAQRRVEGELVELPLALRAGAGLGSDPAAPGEASSSYSYVPVVGTQGPINPYYGYSQLPNVWFWDAASPAGTAATFTTAPLDDDLTLLGSASADLWLTATAPDVDLQVTLTEVRPDGQEQFVQQGWLRASQRALDAGRSSALRPYQTHLAEDVAPLAPGEPVLARVEVFPFGHVFRAGSRLRLWVEAPVFLPALWAFTPSPVPAEVTLLHDAEHPSRLVLPQVPNDPARVATPPPCGSLVRQPCRPDPVTVQAASAGPVRPTPFRPPDGTAPGPPPASAGSRGMLPATGASTSLLLALVLGAGALVLARVRGVGSRPSP